MFQELQDAVKKIKENLAIQFFGTVAFVITVPQLVVGVVVPTAEQAVVKKWVLWTSIFAIILMLLIYFLPAWLDRKLSTKIQRAMGGVETRLDRIEQRLSDNDPQKAYFTLARRYGLAYRELRVVQTIGLLGQVELRREITVVTADETLGKISQSLNIQPGKDETVEILKKERVFVTAQTPGFNAVVDDIVPLAGGWFVEVVFTPIVSANSEIQFTLSEILPEGNMKVGWTKAKFAAENIKNQYFGWRIDRPTQHFHAEVRFPRSYEPKGVRALVAYQPLPESIGDARLHEREGATVQSLLQTVRINDLPSLTMDVELPLLGMMYLLRWDPLSSD